MNFIMRGVPGQARARDQSGRGGQGEALQLSRSAVACRLAAVAVVLALVLVGTLWGQDDAFPFGPFRMYSTRDDPNGVVAITDIEGVTLKGHRIVLTDADAGLRRAEIEGEISTLRDDPQVLSQVAETYERRHVDSRLVRVEVVRHEYRLHDGRSDRQDHMTTLASWSAA